MEDVEHTQPDVTRISKKSATNIPVVVAPTSDELEDLEPLIPAEWEFELVTKKEYRRFLEGCLESASAAIAKSP